MEIKIKTPLKIQKLDFLGTNWRGVALIKCKGNLFWLLKPDVLWLLVVKYKQWEPDFSKNFGLQLEAFKGWPWPW